MMGGGSPDTTQSSTKTQLPGWAKYWAQGGLGALGNLIFPGAAHGDWTPAPSPLPNQQVAPFSAAQRAGLQGIESFGPYSSLIGGAQGLLSDTMAGKYADPAQNPLLANYITSAMSPVMKQYETAIAPDVLAGGVKTGTLGSSGNVQQDQLARYDLATALGNVSAGIYGSERDRMMQAAGMSPEMVQAQYIPSQMMLQAGGQEQAQQQNVLDTLYRNLYQKAMWPYQEMQMLSGNIGPFTGGSGSSVTIQPNAMQGQK